MLCLPLIVISHYKPTAKQSGIEAPGKVIFQPVLNCCAELSMLVLSM